jgi:hypothetical protein
MAWLCHKLLYPLMLPIDMTAASNDATVVVHQACQRETTRFGARRRFGRTAARSDVPGWAESARQFWQRIGCAVGRLGCKNFRLAM